MKNLDNINESTKKDYEKSEISKKKETDIQKNSALYFQVGLIVCLLASYGLLEMNFKHQIISYPVDTPYKNDIPVIVINVEKDAPKAKPVEKKVAMVITKPIDTKPDFADTKELPTLDTPDTAPPVEADPAPTKPAPIDPTPPINKIMNLDQVEIVPIFPGCEYASNNQERLACMSEKLSKLIQRKFNTDLAAQLGLSGVQKIQVQFKIDQTGNVTDIKTRSPYSQLEKEAERVVSKIPTMTPGMQQKTPVSIIYNMPIAFQVQ